MGKLICDTCCPTARYASEPHPYMFQTHYREDTNFNDIDQIVLLDTIFTLYCKKQVDCEHNNKNKKRKVVQQRKETKRKERKVVASLTTFLILQYFRVYTLKRRGRVCLYDSLF